MRNKLPLHTNASRNRKYSVCWRGCVCTLQCANGCCEGSGTSKYSSNMCFLTARLRDETIPPWESGCSALRGARAEGLCLLRCPIEALRGTIASEQWGLGCFICQNLHFNLSTSSGAAPGLQREEPAGCSVASASAHRLAGGCSSWEAPFSSPVWGAESSQLWI